MADVVTRNRVSVVKRILFYFFLRAATTLLTHCADSFFFKRLTRRTGCGGGEVAHCNTARRRRVFELSTATNGFHSVSFQRIFFVFPIRDVANGPHVFQTVPDIPTFRSVFETVRNSIKYVEFRVQATTINSRVVVNRLQLYFHNRFYCPFVITFCYKNRNETVFCSGECFSESQIKLGQRLQFVYTLLSVLKRLNVCFFSRNIFVLNKHVEKVSCLDYRL